MVTTSVFVRCRSRRQRHLNTNGFNSLFVQDAWGQWRGVHRSVFDRERDFLALTVGQLASTVKQAWDLLQEQAAHTSPDRLVQRLTDQGQSSELERAIFESLRTLEDKSVEQPKPYETAELLARIRIFQFGPENESDSIVQCSRATVSGSILHGTQLWNRLIGLAAENRSSGGYLDVLKLIKILRRDFELRDFPEYEADWTRLEQLSSDNARLVHATVGSDIQIQRPEQEKTLQDALDGNRVVVLMGESGSGKSALISKIVQTRRFSRVVWLLPRQLSEPSLSEVSQRLRLQHSIPEMVEHSVKRPALLVLDGFDRFQNETLTHALELREGRHSRRD